MRSIGRSAAEESDVREDDDEAMILLWRSTTPGQRPSPPASADRPVRCAATVTASTPPVPTGCRSGTFRPAETQAWRPASPLPVTTQLVAPALAAPAHP